MGVTLTRVHSCFTVHVWSARWHAARRRARQKFYFYFLATANQRPRLGAALGAAAHPHPTYAGSPHTPRLQLLGSQVVVENQLSTTTRWESQGRLPWAAALSP